MLLNRLIILLKNVDTSSFTCINRYPVSHRLVGVVTNGNLPSFVKISFFL